MRIPGEDAKGVMGGIDFLRKLALKEESGIGKRVAVVGGGNTAMDACRSAVRAGAEEVYTFYRRTREEMPADKVEVNEAEEEGVIFKFLCNPVEILSKDGVVCGIKAQKMELGEPDASGRRSPVPVEGAFEIVELDTVIMAIGQGTKAEGFEELELTRKGTIVADEKTYMTSVEGVFACGDATNKGADIAIRAIGEAINAAASINEYLGGKKRTFAETSQYDLYSSVEPTFEQIREKHSDKAPVQAAITKLEETLKSGTIDAIKADTEALEKALYELSSKLYQQPGAQGGDQGGNPGAGSDDTVYDADFTDKTN
jgi:formate dehydrogenase major subunit